MDGPKTKKYLTEQEAYAKAEHYCAYQDRAQQELRDKLYEWGLTPPEVENMIVKLIEGNFLNEERFAKAYARGKFSQKGWGRIKIKQGLTFKRVPDVLIKKALLTIDGDEYLETLRKLLVKKATTLNERDAFKRRYKLQQYAYSRGFENDLVGDVLAVTP